MNTQITNKVEEKTNTIIKQLKAKGYLVSGRYDDYSNEGLIEIDRIMGFTITAEGCEHRTWTTSGSLEELQKIAKAYQEIADIVANA